MNRFIAVLALCMLGSSGLHAMQRYAERVTDGNNTPIKSIRPFSGSEPSENNPYQSKQETKFQPRNFNCLGIRTYPFSPFAYPAAKIIKPTTCIAHLAHKIAPRISAILANNRLCKKIPLDQNDTDIILIGGILSSICRQSIDTVHGCCKETATQMYYTIDLKHGCKQILLSTALLACVNLTKDFIGRPNQKQLDDSKKFAHDHEIAATSIDIFIKAMGWWAYANSMDRLNRYIFYSR